MQLKIKNFACYKETSLISLNGIDIIDDEEILQSLNFEALENFIAIGKTFNNSNTTKIIRELKSRIIIPLLNILILKNHNDTSAYETAIRDSINKDQPFIDLFYKTTSYDLDNPYEPERLKFNLSLLLEYDNLPPYYSILDLSASGILDILNSKKKISLIMKLIKSSLH